MASVKIKDANGNVRSWNVEHVKSFPTFNEFQAWAKDKKNLDPTYLKQVYTTITATPAKPAESAKTVQPATQPQS